MLCYVMLFSIHVICIVGMREPTPRKWTTILVSMLLNILNSLHSCRIDFSTLACKLDLIKMLFILLIHL